MYIAEPGAKVNWQWGQVGWMLADHRDGQVEFMFLAWSSIAQSVCQRAFSLLAIWCLGSRVQILHSAEEHNLSHFDLNIACLCQNIEINNNKYVYRQSQVRKSTDSGVNWAECSLIIGTGCPVQNFSLILDRSVGLSTSIQFAGDLVSGIPGSNPAFSRGTQLVSFRFEYRLPVPEHRNWQQQICISPEPGAKVNWQWGLVGWMLTDHRDGL